MARPRKRTIKAQPPLLTPDNVVEIPVEEQPYPLPKGWKWVKLLSVFSNHTDSKKKLPQREYLSTGTFPVVDQGKEIIGGYTERESLLYSGPLPVIIFGDHTRCVKFIDFDFVQGADGIKILHAKKIIEHKFFYYTLQNIDIPNLGYRRHFPLFKRIMIPLPPLAEQERIVARIERLFSCLDKAREKVEGVIKRAAVRKAAILHKAFTGELTAQWREAHGIGLDSWEERILKGCGHWCGGGTPSMTQKTYWNNGNILWITPKDMKSDIIEDSLLKVSEEGITNSAANLILKSSLLFVTRSGILRRKLPIAIIHPPFCVNQDLKALQISDGINIKFLFYQCIYYEKDILKKCMKSGTTVESIIFKKLLEYMIKLPSLSEQVEIVRILDELLEKERGVQEAAGRVVERIERIRQTILARAFRGELGTNDPTEPPSPLPE